MVRCEIAGLQVDLMASGRTLEQAKPYTVQSALPADMTIRCDPARALALNPETLTLDAAEYMETGSRFAKALLKFDGFQLHASAVMLDGKAYLFSAPSGTGKSTHTEKWCRLFGARLLNDDKPVLRAMPQGWMAYGTPWSGKFDLSEPTGVIVGGVAFLQRGDENRIRRLQPQDAVTLLISQMMRYLNAEQMNLQLTLLDRFLQQVPVWLLQCRNDDEAAYVSYESMRCGR